MSTENFQSALWDHHAIRRAVDSMAPGDAGAVAAAWEELGRRFQDSMVGFHDATRTAIHDGWRGAAAESATTAIDGFAARAQQVGEQFGEVGAALRHAVAGAEAVRSAVGQPFVHPADWTAVMPWNWAGEAAADAAEQDARAAMAAHLTSAYTVAVERLPALLPQLPDSDLAFTHAASAHGRPVGFDLGPNGIHGIPSDEQVAEPSDADVFDADTDTDMRAVGPESSGSTTGSNPHHSGTGPAFPTGASLAGVVGGGVAQYAGRVVTSHRAEAASAATLPSNTSSSTEDEVEPPTYLEFVDDETAIVGKLPLVTPPVIGE
ncbi:MAG: hypothetical protein WAW17_15585 [Rhodococcus sp. (in: high G+C Gram-positive bacteria)]|uniref:hypothetical protein n=1 Tax=Rhodococcus sp. TaxID=1831 RepID=UPI003BAEF98F